MPIGKHYHNYFDIIVLTLSPCVLCTQSHTDVMSLEHLGAWPLQAHLIRNK